MKKIAINLDDLKIDFSKVNQNEPGSWPLPLKCIAWFMVVVLVVIGGNNFYVADKKTKLRTAMSEETALKKDFEDKAFKAKNLDALRQQMEEATKTLGALLKQLPSQTEVPGLLEDITRTGLGSGLEFNQIQLQAERKIQFYVELPITIKVKGGYHDFATFSSGIASLSRIVTLHDFKLAPTDKDMALTMEITAKTYRADTVDLDVMSDTAKAEPGKDNTKEGKQ